MFTLAVLQAKIYTVKYGVSIDGELAQSILDNPVAFETEIPKGNIRGTACPPISIQKGFNAEKPAYIAFDKSSDSQYLNLSLTNTKPETAIDSNKDVVKLLTTSYKDIDAKSVISNIIKALK